ncbi:MAG TPA: response regulator [Candidatus Limnocylindrales bacterium]|nr:response regulator [Candidatus Limnocylindrales bacterium]
MVARRGLWEWGVAAPLPGDTTGSAILVADDDRDVRTMLRTLLELDGHDVLEAADGDVAWRIIQQQELAVVVADVQMPGMDGLQICRKVRETRLPIKVIVYTAGMATEAEALKAGCDRYFLKTDPLPKLREAVRQYVSDRPN